MYIKQLKLINYRNYQEISVNIDAGINFIIGNNAVGKTNLLEAIYFLENGRSHRTSGITDIIRWDQDFLNVKAIIYRDDRDIALESSIQQNGLRQVKINGVVYKRHPVKQKPILTVLFTPDHLKIVKETPEHRRSYLDEILEKIKPDYGHWKVQYQKILRQRNMLLKKVAAGGMKQDMISCWDTQLIDAGVRIINSRKKIIEELQPQVNKIYKIIARNDQELSLIYENKVLEETNNRDLKNIYQDQLNKRRQDEIIRGQTLVGPHRDDVGIFVDNIDMRAFGSQGEQRTVALALKLAELQKVTELIKDKPILLLDDVMSELDDFRRQALLNLIKNGPQVIITSTNEKYEQIKDTIQANVIRIESR